MFLKRFPHGLIVARHDHLILLLSYPQSVAEAEAQRSLKEQCQMFADYVAGKKWGLRAAFGIGSVKRGLSEVYKSSEEAVKCLQFLKNYKTGSSYISYSELGGKRLLLQNSADELTDYVLEVLGPLLSYEKSRKREFL
ncbi:hypothetical protein EN829_065740, partial [Mesorhizobium sp. M00.F.Ca.ET.186.01.1.1]